MFKLISQLTYLVGLFYSDSNSLPPPPPHKEFKSYNLIPSRKSGENQTGL